MNEKRPYMQQKLTTYKTNLSSFLVSSTYSEIKLTFLFKKGPIFECELLWMKNPGKGLYCTYDLFVKISLTRLG